MDGWEWRYDGRNGIKWNGWMEERMEASLLQVTNFHEYFWHKKCNYKWLKNLIIGISLEYKRNKALQDML